MLKSLLTLIALTVIFPSALALNCFQRYELTSPGENGTSIDCGSETSCHSFSTNDDQRRGGCGNCPSTTPDCYQCTSDNCNSLTPSYISCFARSGTNYTTNGTSRFCHTGVTSCFSFESSSEYYGSCGSCGTGLPPNCVSCNTTHCNSVPPSTISCYNRTGSNSSSTNDGESVACVPGITSCYSYVNGTSLYANCGTCTSTQVSSYGCKSCSTTNCNSVLGSTISCFNRTGSASSGNGTIVACNPGISSCYSYADGVSQYGNCGNCTSAQASSYGCTSCNSTNCNSALVSTISCFIRTGSVSRSNGTVAACNPGISSCYSYADGQFLHANCGSCTLAQASSYGCTSCNTTNCNSVLPSQYTISCFNRTGSVSNSNGTTMACNLGISSCYSYEDGTSSYAACGACTTMQVSNFGCKSCNTSSCNYLKRLSNSATAAGTGVKTAVLVVGVLVLAMMKLN